MSCNVLEDNNYWIGKHYSFMQNKECEFFPCHNKIDINEFNCLFCYCPLFCLGTQCGGNYNIIESKGRMIKDCSNCIKPHIKQNYKIIVDKYEKVNDLIQDNLKNNSEL